MPKSQSSDAPEVPEVPTSTYEVWHQLNHDNVIYKRGQQLDLPVDKAAPLVAARVLVAPGTAASIALITPEPVAPQSIVPVTA